MDKQKEIDDLDILLADLEKNKDGSDKEPSSKVKQADFLDASERYTKSIYKIFTFFPEENLSLTWKFLKKHNIFNKHGLLQTTGNKGQLKGEFFKMNNYIFDCLSAAKLDYAEYKFFLWAYRWTIGFHGRRYVIFEKQDLIAKECGLTRPTIRKAFKNCINKKLIYAFKQNISRFKKEIEVTGIQINPFPCLWQDVGPRPKEIMQKWVIQKESNIEAYKSGKVKKPKDWSQITESKKIIKRKENEDPFRL